MLKKSIIILGGTLLSMNLMADFPGDFKAATGLYSNNKYTEAQEAFAKLANSAPTPKSKAECLAYAASCISREKKYEEALALAKTIELKPVSMSCQMEIMQENKKFKELIEAFKNEDISVWPNDYSYKAYFNRGTAYSATADYPSAAGDMEKAVEIAGSDKRFKMIALNSLGNVYQNMKDEQKALDAYQKVVSRPDWKGTWFYTDSVIKSSDILTRQGKYDASLAELGKLDLGKSAGLWKVLILQAYGDVYVAKGLKDEGKAKYNEALATEDISSSCVEQLKKKLDLLNNK